jgi:hypothetical protein
MAMTPMQELDPAMRGRGIAAAFTALVTVGVGVLVAVNVLAPSAPPLRALSWRLGDGYQVPEFDAVTARTTRTLWVDVDQVSCGEGQTYLARSPVIDYRPTAVTITFPIEGDPTDCSPFLSGTGEVVQLREPLGGRLLFDGSQDPPSSRPYEISSP